MSTCPTSPLDLVLPDGAPVTLWPGALVRVGGVILAEVVGRADKVVLLDRTGRGIGARGARHRELVVAGGDTITFEVPSNLRRWDRLRALVVRPIALPTPVATERRPVCWRALITASRRGYQALFELAQAADSGAPLWITGESGTGKELAAAAVHHAGPRARGAFEAINCAALPAELVESELFGVERGAYTGAMRSRPGAFARAHGGTLFLDEVGELPLPAQAKLLRALELGEVRPVGADRVVKVDVRVVAASWRDLEAEAVLGRFRHDLLHRLCVLRVSLPSLRERPDDIAPILAELLRPTLAERTSDERDPLWPDEALLDILKHQAWPGNVRELKNGALRALATLDPRDLVGRQLAPAERPIHEGASLETALALYRGNRTKAARALGVSRSTFYRWIERAGGMGQVHTSGRDRVALEPR